MSNFEQHIRDYYRQRLGVEFVTTDYGFAGCSTDGTSLYIHELYVVAGTSHTESFRFFRRLFSFARELGCTRIVGANDTSLSSYESIKKLHIFFGAKPSGELNGTSEIWIKELL